MQLVEGEKKKKLLIVDDDPLQVELLARLLSKGEHEVLTATDGDEALRIVLSQEPRIVITDWYMPRMSGLALCKALREHEGVRFVYIIMMTAQSGDESMVEALDAGADDFIRKPVNPAELLARLRAADRIVSAESDLAKRTREVHRVNAAMAVAHDKLNRANELLRQMATTDELTGILNRREAMTRIETLWDEMARYNRVFACIMVDIDHFKRFNDTHGHAAGDMVLRSTAQLLKQSCRKTDLVYRVGGEEFLVLCPGVGVEGGSVCAEHLREAVENASFEFEGRPLHVTVSLGVAEATTAYPNSDAMMKAADEALYASKAQGRNRVTLSRDGKLSPLIRVPGEKIVPAAGK